MLEFFDHSTQLFLQVHRLLEQERRLLLPFTNWPKDAPEAAIRRWSATVAEMIARAKDPVSYQGYGPYHQIGSEWSYPVTSLFWARPYLRTLDTADADLLDVARRITQVHLDRRTTEGLDLVPSSGFEPRIIKFVHNRLRRYSGLPHREVTDLSLIEEHPIASRRVHDGVTERRVRLTIDGLLPFPGSQANAAGYFSREVDSIAITPEFMAKKVAWTRKYRSKHGRLDLTAKVEIRPADLSLLEIAPVVATPFAKRPALMTGYIIIGDNMADEAEDLVTQYRSYYERNGFKFAKRPTATDDAKAHLAAEIREGRLDYLVKEAHADGDDRNILRMRQRGKLWIGVKKGAGAEKVYIFDPGQKSSKAEDTALLTAGEFGTWVRKRKLKAADRFVMINSSCGAMNKVRNEIVAVRDASFVDIGSNSIVSTFYDAEDSILREVVDGLRENRSFAEARKRIDELNKKYGDSEEYIFPDSEAFEKEVRMGAQIPIEVAIEIRDQFGKAFNVDDAPKNAGRKF